mgnify:CR=1 FL=1
MAKAFVETARRNGFECDVASSATDYLVSTQGQPSASVWIASIDAKTGYLLAFTNRAVTPLPFDPAFHPAVGAEPNRQPQSKVNANFENFDDLLAALDEGLALIANDEALLKGPATIRQAA